MANTTGWTDDCAFIAFAFGDFNSLDFGANHAKIYRTSEGDRYNINLTPSLQDKTAEVPGGDGMYYFGTTHKQKDFSVNYAFDRLRQEDIQELKKAFSGKEIKELCFSEQPDRIYMAKVTGQASIKTLAFAENGEDIYKGEGTIQFTAYWPYARGPRGTTNALTLNRQTITFTIDNEGDMPIPIKISVLNQKTLSKIRIGEEEITGTGIKTFDSKTGIVTNGTSIISYNGNGLINLPVGETTLQLTGEVGSILDIEYYPQYY